MMVAVCIETAATDDKRLDRQDDKRASTKKKIAKIMLILTFHFLLSFCFFCRLAHVDAEISILKQKFSFSDVGHAKR